ncbi:MAG: ribbon-helix-helix domain-containing protein [Robiginitomaculum sp.]
MSKSRTKRSLSIHAHRTSISLEPEFWSVIDDIAKAKNKSLAALITTVDDERTETSSQYGLAAYLRLYALKSVQARIANANSQC